MKRMLRTGMRAGQSGGSRRSAYRETTKAMGVPRDDLQKALVAAALEDDEILRKMTRRK